MSLEWWQGHVLYYDWSIKGNKYASQGKYFDMKKKFLPSHWGIHFKARICFQANQFVSLMSKIFPLRVAHYENIPIQIN